MIVRIATAISASTSTYSLQVDCNALVTSERDSGTAASALASVLAEAGASNERDCRARIEASRRRADLSKRVRDAEHRLRTRLGVGIQADAVRAELASGDPDTDIAEAERMLADRRHRIFKLKIGARDPAEDVSHVTRIAQALGGRAALTVDVNQAWDGNTARRYLPALVESGVGLIEQPVK